MRILRKYREENYARLQDAAYERRGWSKQGCPTVVKIKELGLDFEDVINVITPYQ